MPTQNLSDTRVIDPVLSTLARGYRHAMFVFPYLFPFAMVGQRGGTVISFRAEDFVKRDLIRAPGASRQRLNVGYDGEKYVLDQRSLDGTLPIERLEEAWAVPGIDLGRNTVNTVMQSIGLQIEIQAAELATSSDNYSGTHTKVLAGESQWSHANSKPAQAVEDVKKLIRQGIGLNPNTMVIGVDVYDQLVNHPDVIDRIKHTQGLTVQMRDGETVVNPGKLANYFGVQHLAVAEAQKGEVGKFSSVWGKNVILAYTGMSSLEQASAAMGEPSFGYTYRLNGYPIAREPWLDPQHDSWIYPVTCEDSSVIAGKDAGYLFTSVV